MVHVMSELQSKAFAAARDLLKGKPWFRGVCVDDFPRDEELIVDFDGCVSGIVFETSLWDDPDFSMRDILERAEHG